jgi:hypothetical protein
MLNGQKNCGDKIDRIANQSVKMLAAFTGNLYADGNRGSFLWQKPLFVLTDLSFKEGKFHGRNC